MQLIIFLIIFVAEFLTTPVNTLFYDQVEYLEIVSTHNFWQVLSLGHFPIHPFFQSFFWITSRITIPNYTALIFGIFTSILMYMICRKIFRRKYFWIPCVIFLLFPGIWILNTNLLIQSMLLCFYLLAIYLFLDNRLLLFSLTVFILMGIDLDAIYWIPSIFLLPYLLKKEVKLDNRKILRFVKAALFSVFLSILFYGFIYIFVRKELTGTGEQFFSYASSGIIRIVRNIWVSFINNFGSITAFVLLFLLLKYVRSKTELICWGIFILLVSFGGGFWAGDLMMRRIAFAGVILAIVIYKYLGNKAALLILFLIPITGFNAALYYKNLSDMPLLEMQQRINALPKNQVLISSHYYFPFIHYDGKILWFESDNTNQVEDVLKGGTRVFITKESITAPYLLVVGNNYHITSLNKVGNSESRKLFTKYKVILYGDSFELKEPDGKDISKSAGEPVIFYGNGFWQRLSRMRINYGDIGVWLWSVISGHKDAVGWTYKDARGVWLQI